MGIYVFVVQMRWIAGQRDVLDLFTLTFDSSPIKKTFAKLSGAAIVFSDSQSAKLDFPIDSRLRGNDGRFCKGLHQGRGDSVGWFVLLFAPRHAPPCGFPPTRE